MTFKEGRPIEPRANRADKRRGLEILKNLNLDGESNFVFKKFTHSEEEERLINRSINNQLELLTGIARGIDREDSYSRLMDEGKSFSKPIDLYEAMMPLNGDKSEYLFSCFYEGKIVRQVFFNKKNNQVNSVADFFYYRHESGGEGVIEMRHDLLKKGMVEIFYKLPVNQDELVSRVFRDQLNALMIIKEAGQSAVYGRQSRYDGEFDIQEISTYENGEEVVRRVVYNHQDEKSFYSFYASRSEADEDLLVVRRHLADKGEDEQWLFVPDPHRDLDYSYILEDLAQGYLPEEDPSIEFLAKIYVNPKVNRIQLDFEGETLDGKAIENDSGEPAMLFVDRDGPMSLLISINPDTGDVSNYNFQDGIASENPRLN